MMARNTYTYLPKNLKVGPTQCHLVKNGLTV